MTTPTFTVVVPAYNRASTIIRSLISVQSQTYGNFECIIVDDGSSDSAELKLVVESLRDPRFSYRWRPNGGGGAARNTGIEAASGAWIAFLDSDDVWLPGKLEEDLRALALGTVLFSPVTVVRGGRKVGLRPGRGPRAGEHISEYLTVGQGWTQTSTMVVPGNIRARFAEDAKFGQDTDFALRLAQEGFSFQMLPQSNVLFVDDEGNRVSRCLDWKLVDAWLKKVSPLMTNKAAHAYRGWHIARIAAAGGHLFYGLMMYLQALIRGSFSPSLALKALLQIVIRRSTYRRVQSRLATCTRPFELARTWSPPFNAGPWMVPSARHDDKEAAAPS